MIKLQFSKTEGQKGFIHTLATIIVLGAVLVGVFFYWQYKNDQNLVCVQVTVKAKNPLSGEVKEFGNPCDVPEGWQQVSASDEGASSEVGGEDGVKPSREEQAPATKQTPSNNAQRQENEESMACIQVITRAREPQSGQEQDFPTPCDVPEGWQIIQPQVIE